MKSIWQRRENKLFLTALVLGSIVLIYILVLSWNFVSCKVEKKISFTPTLTRSEAPDVMVPEITAANTPSNFAIPIAVASISEVGTLKSRSFRVRVDKGKFVPDTVVANRGDTIIINFESDEEMDIVQPDYGMMAHLSKGKPALWAMTVAAEGKFSYVCGSCLDKGPKGYIIVKE